MAIEIREEQFGDFAAIRDINQRAFLQDQEATIVDALRASGGAQLSLVAAVDGRLVGHIMYSPASIGAVVGAALGPMAVLPEYQRQGIGSGLVRKGNEQLKKGGCPFILVLGHPEYYPRFGFKPASMHGVKCAWVGVPDNVFMLLVLDEKKLAGVSGVAKYRHEFSGVV